MSVRLGFFWTAMSIADITCALLAYGILHMRGVEGQAGWRWLFLIEVGYFPSPKEQIGLPLPNRSFRPFFEAGQN